MLGSNFSVLSMSRKASKKIEGVESCKESMPLSVLVSGGEVKYIIPCFYAVTGMVSTSEGLIKKCKLYQGYGNETDIGSETTAVAPETPVVVTVVKEEGEEERKRKNYLRIQEQVATVIPEDAEVTRFTFPEANGKDLSLGHNGQGFSFSKEQNVYFKRVKLHDLGGA